MAYPLKLFSSEENTPFNPKLPDLIHLDLNSCFASVEQQANPNLRGKPVAVTPTLSLSGCVISPSREAKTVGIKTGMKNREAMALYPNLIIMEADPAKYRFVHLKLKKLLLEYSNSVIPKSIDEFIVDFKDYPNAHQAIKKLSNEIKGRIKEEIGEVLTVSVGIGPNRFLAKTAAGIHKPDGLDEINFENYLDIFRGLELRDLPGINFRNQRRLNQWGINSVEEFAKAPLNRLMTVFESIAGYYWYLKLRGWEIEDSERDRKSYGNSCVIGQALRSEVEVLAVIQKLTEKMGARMRKASCQARGVHLSVMSSSHEYWHKGRKLDQYLSDSRQIYQELTRLFKDSYIQSSVKKLAVTCFDLQFSTNTQLELFRDTPRQSDLVLAIDQINRRWGSFTVAPARMMKVRDEEVVVDRIAFGGVKELEEINGVFS